jgi:hypothetical protein
MLLTRRMSHKDLLQKPMSMAWWVPLPTPKLLHLVPDYSLKYWHASRGKSGTWVLSRVMSACRKHVLKFTHITRVDLQLRGNDSAKISKNLKLPTCASISVQMKVELKIIRYGFCLEGEKLSN